MIGAVAEDTTRTDARTPTFSANITCPLRVDTARNALLVSLRTISEMSKDRARQQYLSRNADATVDYGK